MIHIERVHLPAGLRALAHRDRRGNLVIYVSDGLDAKGQRAAIMEAVRATRRAGWRKTGLLPVGAALYLAIRPLLHAVHTLAIRPLAWGAAATATAVGASTAAIFIVATPHAHQPSAAGQPPGAGARTVQPSRPAGRPPAGPTPRRPQGHPVAASTASPGPGQAATAGRPRPAHASSGGTSPTSGSSPGSSPSPAQPSPTPTPSPSGKAPVCVIVLGVKVCV